MAGIRISAVAFIPSPLVPYAVLGSTSDYNIWAVTESPGQDPAKLTLDDPGGDVRQGPEKSPDGQQIAYERKPAGFSELWITDIDGSNDVLLDDGGGATFVQYPSWAPDGSHILYTISACGSNAGGAIYKINPDGTGKTLIWTPPTDGAARRPRYNFDGSRIACLVNDDGCGGAVYPDDELWTMDPDGTNDVVIVTLIASMFGQCQFGWANSSDVLAYYSGNDGGTLGGIFKINGDGTGNTLLSIDTDGAALHTISDQCWQSDDSRVFFTANVGSGYEINEALADGSNQNVLYSSHICLNLDTLRSGWVFGQRIYFFPSAGDRLSSITVAGADYRIEDEIDVAEPGSAFSAETGFDNR